LHRTNPDLGVYQEKSQAVM